MLDGYEVGECAFDHSGVSCYPAMEKDSDKRYIVKKISLPASQVQVEALLLTGAYPSAQAAGAYYEELAQEVRGEVQTLEKLASQRGFVPYKDCQIVPMAEGVGFEVYLLGRYRRTLERYLRRNPMTYLGAVNLGIDMCAALAVCREAGWLYVDLKPENIFLFGDQEYRIGDLGFASMDSLSYASLPDRYRSVYTVPEVTDAYSSLNATMDTYALGLVLYQVYNEGKLPFSTAEERKAWLDRLAAGERVPAPACADEEMAGIIAKAIAYDPSERWQTPAEMGHALISYMQRNGADDVPIQAPVVPEPEETVPETVEAVLAESAEEAPAVETSEEAPAGETAEEAPIEEVLVEEAAEEPAGTEESEPAEPEAEPAEAPAAEETPDAEPIDEPEEVIEEALTELVLEDEPEEAEPEDLPEDAPAEEPAADDAEVDAITADWIDLMDAILSEDAPETEGESAPSDAPSLRQLLEGGDALAEADQLTADDVSAETADMLNLAQELIEHEAPAPVVAPEPIDVPMPEPIVLELPEEETEEEPQEEEASEGTPTEEPTPAPVETKPKSGVWKKVLGTVAALAIAAGLGYGAWYYYQNYYLQPVSMTYDGSGTQVSVCVETALDHSKLTVICKDTYGNAVNGTLENGTVTFADLVPGSQYIITLEAEGFYKLVGQTSVTYSTPNETQVINLAAVTGQEDGSAILSFGVEGADSEEWTLTYEAEGVEPQSVTFTGHTVTIPGLTVGSAYTFTLTAPEDVTLVGETSITHTASGLVQAKNVALANYVDGAITVTWSAPEGVSVERWFVRCYNSTGYDQLQEVTESSAVFADISEGASYTIEVTASGMTLGTRTDITAEESGIYGLAAVLNGSTIDLSWNSSASMSGTPWTIECSADGKVLQVLTAEENKASYGPAVPGTTYTFNVKPINISADIPGGTTTVEVPAAGAFSANKLDSDSIIVEMYNVPTKSNWSYGTLQRSKEASAFKAGGSLALLYTVTKPYSFDSTAFETLFVIRDANGALVSASSRTRVWDDMWDNGYCTETVTNLPAAPGAYTLTIYLGGGQLAQLNFTIE